jgi:hypothetical protein
VLEGVAFGLRQIRELVIRQYPGVGAPIVISGGAVAVRNQIKASVLAQSGDAEKHAGMMRAITAAVGHCTRIWVSCPNLVKMGQSYSRTEPAGVTTGCMPSSGICIRRWRRFLRIYQVRQEVRRDMPDDAVFRAGKIARGFIAHLLQLSGCRSH